MVSPVQNLLSRPAPSCIDDITAVLKAAKRAFPIPSAHQADLPFAIRDLSRLLTAERGMLGHSYWMTPRFISAYLHFFLPWNLYRLSWLLPTLPMNFQAGSRILDIGSGPLTLPLALWCSRPDLRTVPLHFICCDVATRPLEIGREILQTLSGAESPWTVELLRAPLDAALAKNEGNLAAVFAGNVLNELPTPRRGTLEERMHAFMKLALTKLAPAGYFFALEPGTRLGGKMVGLARKGGLHSGFQVLAPCPHSHPCPAMDQQWFYPPSPSYSGWCHFIHPAHDAPTALRDLSEKANLEKDSLAISCLLLQRPQSLSSAALKQHTPAHGAYDADDTEAMLGAPDAYDAHDFSDNSLDALEALYQEILQEDHNAAPAPRHSRSIPPRHGSHSSREESPPMESQSNLRVISGMIRLPGYEEPGRYACCSRGLALVMDAARIPSGAAVPVVWPPQDTRDGKTCALMVEWRSNPVSQPAPKTYAPRPHAAQPHSERKKAVPPKRKRQ